MPSKVLIIATVCTIVLAVACTILVLVGMAAKVSFSVILNLPQPPRTTQPPFAITINNAMPSGQAFSDGFIYLQCSLPSDIAVQGNVMVYVDGAMLLSVKEFPTNLQIPTFELSNGIHSVSLTALSTNNVPGSGVIQVLVEDPRLKLISLDYPLVIYPGLEMEIIAEVAGSPAFFIANYSAIFGENGVINSTSRVGNVLTETRNISLNITAIERFYDIPFQVFNTNQQSLAIPGVKVFFQAAEPNPFTIEVGITNLNSFPQSPPTATAMNLTFALPPKLERVALTTDQTVTIPLELDGDSNAVSILVGFEGFGQHFTVPLSSIQSEVSRRSTRFSSVIYNLRLTLASGSIHSEIVKSKVLLRLLDNLGSYGPIKRVSVTLASSQLSTLHARLSWDRDVDLDLHVVGPNDDEIYFGHTRSSGQVGFLDRDSICGSNGNIEDVFYDRAISGRYIVRVDLFSNCGVDTTIAFDLFVEGCNISKTVSGTFEPSEADQGRSGAGREVLNFIAECPIFRAAGTVSYMTPNSGSMPTGSVVRVVDGQGKILGKSRVGKALYVSRRRSVFSPSRWGAYSVSYDVINASQPVFVEFLSKSKKIDVIDHAGKTHIYRVNISITPESEAYAVRDVVIQESDGSGAFHIMATLERMIPLYLAYGGRPSNYPIKADWELGRFAKGTNFAVSFFSSQTGIISIGGHVTDPDQFDDSVLLHEFGHLILHQTGAVITGSGSHSFGNQISPNFAFKEGYATYLGQKVIGDLQYCDGLWCIDLSDVEREGIPLGTSLPGDNSAGDISEGIVASAAFALDFDVGLGMSLRNSLTDPAKLLTKSNYDRLGDRNAVDFSDMVSLTVCPLTGSQKNDSVQLLESKYRLPWIDEDQFCQ